MQKITTYLWFDNQAEEAARFYTTLFPDSEILEISRYGEGAPVPAGTVMVVRFRLAGQQFLALNGGPHFEFNEAISLYVDCATQQEVDELWSKLTADGGKESMCGWLRDRWGVSWQIIPTELPALLTDPDPARAQRATQAMLRMQKIELADVKNAADGIAV